jgi:hypothetical protein
LVPHPTFFLLNGFFRIESAELKPVSTLDHTDTERPAPAER